MGRRCLNICTDSIVKSYKTIVACLLSHLLVNMSKSNESSAIMRRSLQVMMVKMRPTIVPGPPSAFNTLLSIRRLSTTMEAHVT
jgi:hypothetical protein